MLYTGKKTAVIRLGNSCNLKCYGCHCCNLNFVYNKDIIKYIRDNNFTDIFFSGGEPLLYFDIIKKITRELKDTVSYKLVTNATLLNETMVSFFNSWNFKIIVSYNGENSLRDNSLPVRYDLISKIDNNDLAILYENNANIFSLSQDVLNLRSKYNLTHKESQYFWFNFYHQTANAPIELRTSYIFDYCNALAIKLECEFQDYINSHRVWNYYPVIGNSFNKWIRRKNYQGIKCLNPNNISLTISGDFLLCPYGDIKVGDIYTGIDWNKVESYIPERCKNCPQWGSCMNTCIANITENECYISKVMYKHFYKLMAKYNVTYEELESKINF